MRAKSATKENTAPGIISIAPRRLSSEIDLAPDAVYDAIKRYGRCIFK